MCLTEEKLKCVKLRQDFELKEKDVLRFIYSFAGDLNDVNKRTEILDLFVDKIYVYEDKLVITFHYTADKQELNYEETQKMIESKKYLNDMLDRSLNPNNASCEMLESIIKTGEEGDSASF